MIIDAHATDTVPSHEVRRRAQEALTNAGEPMSEVTYDALRKRIAELEAALRFYADDENWRLNGQLDPNSGNFTGGPARAVIKKDRQP